jgi:hypothetical protein
MRSARLCEQGSPRPLPLALQMYSPRLAGQLSPLAKRLSEVGILAVDNIYSVVQVNKINAAMNPIFAAKAHEGRSYVRPDEMMRANILYDILSRKMRDLIFSIVPDPVLYHLHAYEIAGNSARSHIFSESLAGWHRDSDSAHFPGNATHVSIFVYLSDVGAEDGPFEFAKHPPDSPLEAKHPAISVTGEMGTSFIWNRTYYHRAAPNRGSNRRRLIKISVQPNAFHSEHLGNDYFRNVIKDTPPGNTEIDLLLGRYQGRHAPTLKPASQIEFFDMEPNCSINVSE